MPKSASELIPLEVASPATEANPQSKSAVHKYEYGTAEMNNVAVSR